MLRTGKNAEGVATACGRIDALARMVGPELGRWMIEVAGRSAGRSIRSRVGESAEGAAPSEVAGLPAAVARSGRAGAGR
ncbi:MAG TPA: hypothetical protein PK280_12530 [Planctomycetota bacterium]|nr:hypothetical protein [Planctomycetota bacterium]